MRVVLVGRPGDRTRTRRQLQDADIDVVTESDAMPAMDSVVAAGADAVVVAAPESSRDSSLGRDLTVQEELTVREREVLTLLAEGLPNRTIASELGISDQTVKFHVASIIAKLGATNRTDAVRRAIRSGLVPL